jgi:mannosyltransferase OCH1-like enzyme
MRANAQAIGVLKHSLRDAPQAAELRKKLPEPKLLEKYSKYKGSAANVAACIIILLLMKIGVFSSMDSFQTRGQEVFKQYYAKHVGQDLADEIFTS